MSITIREEQVADYKLTEELVQRAFAGMTFSDQTEHELVSRIRKSDAFIPPLSLVAISPDQNEIVGHILLSKIVIRDGDQQAASLALAPVSVSPEYQKQGIGGQLIEQALQQAKKLGYHSVVVLGHPDYYPKFGFKKASEWGIRAPFEVPDEAFLAIDLHPNTLDHISGVVEYSRAFFE